MLLQVAVGNWKQATKLLSQQFTVLHLVTYVVHRIIMHYALNVII